MLNSYRSQDINGYLISMFIREDHPQRQQISAITERAFESGLFVKWARDTATELRSKFVSDHHVHVASALQVKHIILPSLIHIFLMTCATVFCLVERTAFQKLQKHPCSRFWGAIERFFDGKRYAWKTIGPIQGKPMRKK